MPHPIAHTHGGSVPDASGASSFSPNLGPETEAAENDDGLPRGQDRAGSDSDSSGSISNSSAQSARPDPALALLDGPTSLSPILNAEGSAFHWGGDPSEPVVPLSASEGGTGSTAVSSAATTTTRSSKTGSPAPANGLGEGVRRRSSGPTRLREMEGGNASPVEEPVRRLELGLPDGVDSGLVVTWPMLERINSFERGDDFGRLDLGTGDDGGLDGLLELMSSLDETPLSAGTDVAFDSAPSSPFGGLLEPPPLRLPSAASGSPAFETAEATPLPSTPFDPRPRSAARSALGRRRPISGPMAGRFEDEPALPFEGTQGQGDGVFLDGTDISRPSSSLASGGSSPTPGGGRGGGGGTTGDRLAERLALLSIV